MKISATDAMRYAKTGGATVCVTWVLTSVAIWFYLPDVGLGQAFERALILFAALVGVLFTRS